VIAAETGEVVVANTGKRTATIQSRAKARVIRIKAGGIVRLA
jgi:translation initiation factor IF-1